ncbi:MAG: sulfatase-like hydrolase/transferase [Opitutales bacterium]
MKYFSPSSIILFLCVLGICTSLFSQQKPNLLFIMTDQHRFDALSIAGNETVKTPNLDRIAKEGVFFENAYTANPVCVPARASFLTGLSPVASKVEGNGDYENPDIPRVPTFDSVLAENGYAAEYYGKWHTPYQFAECYDNKVKAVGPIGNRIGAAQIREYQRWLYNKGVKPKEPGEGQLFSNRNQRPYTPIPLDVNYENAQQSTDEKMKIRAKQHYQYGRIDLPANVSYAAYTAEETLEALDRLAGKPFTLTASFDPPHPPMILQEPYYSMYDPADIPVPECITDLMTDSPYKKKAAEPLQKRYRNAEHIQHMRSIYYGMITEVDDWVGKILDKLDTLGIAENTLIIFTADHGEMLGDHGMNSKVMFYEGAVHIPLLMRFPQEVSAGTVVSDPVSALDVFSTILDYMDMPIPPSNGISLRPFIEGNAPEHDVISYSLGRDVPNYMIRHQNLKLLLGQDANYRGVDALYDLEADPLEMRNPILSPIAPEKNRAQAMMMQERLVNWLKKHEPHKAEGIEQRKLF